MRQTARRKDGCSFKEVQADFLELQGDRVAAKTLAAKTYFEALALGIGPIAEHAMRLLDDDTLLLQWERKYQLMRAGDRDLKHASQSDEELSRVAKQMLLSVESPSARLCPASVRNGENVLPLR